MEYLSKNLHLFRRMKELAAQQEAFLSKDRVDLFLQLANQREQIRQQITASKKNEDAFPNGPGPKRGGASARLAATELAEVIRSIQEIDRKTEEFVLMRKQTLFSELESLKHGRKAVRGYGGGAGSGQARFVDRQG
jgi:hypothetical protein